MNLREAAQHALEFVTSKQWGTTPYMDVRVYEDAARLRDALRAALAQPAPEPVAWIHTDACNPKVRFLEWTQHPKGYRGDWIKTPLYAAPEPIIDSGIQGDKA